MLKDLLAANTYDKTILQTAKELGFGLELDDYIRIFNRDEALEKHKEVSPLVDGFLKLSFHGTVMEYEYIINYSDEALLGLYNESYEYACFHAIDKIVFHANYVAGRETRPAWINRQASFWKQFLQDKPENIRVYIENFVDETPELMAQLHDAINDPRVKLCLDTGHACCNSGIHVLDWIKILGRRIEHVHLHNNDGESDKHWPLGRGILDCREVIEKLLEYANLSTIVLEGDFNESLIWLRENGLLD